MSNDVLKQSKEFIYGYKILLESIQKKHGDTDGKEIQNLIDRVNKFLSELDVEIKVNKPDKAMTRWTKGTKEAMVNYKPGTPGNHA
jgi:hypothetical protein